MRLSKWEKRLLPLSLVTTIEEAETIKKRNKRLLWGLRIGIFLRGEYGCPHCQEVTRSCNVCRWSLVKYSLPKWSSMPCMWFRFDGVALREQEIVEYGPYTERVRWPHLSNLRKARKFLKAHIKWSKRIMNGTYREYAEKHGGEVS